LFLIRLFIFRINYLINSISFIALTRLSFGSAPIVI
jgi:hypothetical protein